MFKITGYVTVVSLLKLNLQQIFRYRIQNKFYKYHIINILINKTQNKALILLVLFAVSLVVPAQLYHNHSYNNFIIFRSSFSHLLHGMNLYGYFPKEYNDIYLYSPAFAVLMAPFSYIPIWAGLYLWTVISCALIYVSIIQLPGLDMPKLTAVFFIILLELITSLQNMQTNAIIAAFMVLAFISFEQKKVFFAAFFIVFAAYIKLFGLAAAMLFLLYPGRGKFVAYMFFWGLVFTILPLIIVPVNQLIIQYQNWFHQMLDVHHGEDTMLFPNVAAPLSVMAWLRIWFGLKTNGIYIQLCGLILLVLPLLRINQYKNPVFRYFLISSILIFCVIFNHIAESPSYIIAVFGVALWFVNEEKAPFAWILFVLACIFTILSATSFFPEYVRHSYAIPKVWKVVPCIFIWIWIQAKLLFGKNFGKSLIPSHYN